MGRRAERRIPPREDVQLAIEAKLFRALGDPTRLRVLELILERERSVSELVDLTEVPQGRVSSHLACLRWCGLVTSRQEGRRVFYRVADERVRGLIATTRSLAKDNASAIFACDWTPDSPAKLTLKPPARPQSGEPRTRREGTRKRASAG